MYEHYCQEKIKIKQLTWYFCCNSSVSSFSISITFLLRVASSACSNYNHHKNVSENERMDFECYIT